MSVTQKKTPTHTAIAFVDYRPAELQINTQWLVVYYAKHPITNIVNRFRVNVPAHKSVSERKKHGKLIALEINKKLSSGWLPWYNNTSALEFKTFEFCKTQFLSQISEEIKKGQKRIDTLRSYNSCLAMIDKYVIEKKIDMKMMLDFNKSFLQNFLDWIYFERKNSARTHNNHLLFNVTFINHCVSRGYMKENFATSIPTKKLAKKTRTVLDDNAKQKLKELEATNNDYFVLCMATYYCFLRRTELTKLKVSDVKLQENYLFVSGDISKNKKGEAVTIPQSYIGMLAQHIGNAKQSDFLFSADNFKPGVKQLNPKKVSDDWAKFRTAHKLGAQYQFYSLKDTGITDLMNTGIPMIKVRDQARHYDIKITETYMARNQTSDAVVQNVTFAF